MVDAGSCCNNGPGEAAGQASGNSELNWLPGVTSPRTAGICPANRQKGKAVENQTVKALLNISLRSVRDTQYFYCSTPDCPVVYFTADGAQTFTVDELREKVYHKEGANPAVLVCYCFQCRVEVLNNGSPSERQAILADIKRGIASGQCACDLRNPQGSCCLGNVSKLVKELNSKL